MIKQTNKQFIFLIFLIVFSVPASISAQTEVVLPLLSPPAKITQQLGVTNITINYSRPKVKNRKIWGELVPYGYNSPNAITGDASSPWRAGAEETTTISFSDDVIINDKTIKKGTYSLFISVFEDNTADIILNNAPRQFGSFFYQDEYDVVKFKVTTEEVSFTEDLEYGFNNTTIDAVEVYLQWEKLMIPFKIKTDTHQLALENILKQETDKGWQWRVKATDYAINYRVHLEKALQWASEAIDTVNFKGAKGYNTLTNYASLLLLNDQEDEAYKSIEELLPLIGVEFSPFYGEKLQELRFPKAALIVWDYIAKNDTKNDKGWLYENGYAFAYSSLNEYKKAIKHLKNSKKFAPEGYDVKKIDNLIDVLKQKKDINPS